MVGLRRKSNCCVTKPIVQLELMKRKQSLLHLDQRQTMLLENAYYQVRRERENNIFRTYHFLYDRSGEPS